MGKIFLNGMDYSAPSSGGGGDTAKKLCTSTGSALSVGSATRPVYFKDGIPVSGSYTLEKSVPSDAKFTDSKVGQTILFNGSKTIPARGSDNLSISGYTLGYFDMTVITTNYGMVIFYGSDVHNAIFAQNTSSDYIAYIALRISYDQEEKRIVFSDCYECYYENGYECSMRPIAVTIKGIIGIKFQEEE